MNIIVTGGTRGIGKEAVLHLSKDQKNRILVTGRDLQALKKLSEISENIKYFRLDLNDLKSKENNFLEEVSLNFKKVDILLNMAGFLVNKYFMLINDDERRKMMEINFFGPASVIALLKPHMKKGSHIVNISSMGGFQGSSKYRGLSYYSASKAAVVCLTECLSNEFMEDGIIVNCLSLGAVDTDMFKEAFPGFKAPVTAKQMGEYVAEFCLKGQKFYNGKIIPVAFSNP